MNDPSIGYVLKRTHMLFRSKMDAVLSAHDLTTPQFACLFQLHEDAGLSNAELARRCFITPQTMHKIVVGLEKKGLIKREPEPQHLRIQRTLLTPAGEQVLTQSKATVSALEKAMATPFSADEIQRLQVDLEALHDRLAQLP
jgi:DNA-binding MarR family transcriptional regulator